MFTCAPGERTSPRTKTEHVEFIGRDRDSPEPSTDQMSHARDLEDLALNGTELGVKEYFKANILPNFDCILKRDGRLSTVERFIPDPAAPVKVTTPTPDILCGYKHEAFPGLGEQLMAHAKVVVENESGPVFPIFLVEFKLTVLLAAGVCGQ